MACTAEPVLLSMCCRQLEAWRPAYPTKASQPQNTLLNVGVPTTLSVVVSGTGPFRYQWRRNGTDVVDPSSQSSVLTVTPTALDDGATYYCAISSPYGKLASNCGLLGNPPAVVAQTPDQAVPPGAAGTLSVACSGTSLMFWQWFSNGVPVSTASPANQGNLVTAGRGVYTVIASNAFGASTLSAPMTITDGPSQMFTLSVSQGIQGDGSYAIGTHSIPIVIPAYYASADYPVFDHWNPPWMGGVTGVTCTIASPRSAQTVATFSGNLTNLAGVTVSVVPIYRASKARLTVVNGLGSGHYDLNVISNADILALPAPPGYRFDHWESTAAIQSPLSPSTRITLTNGQTLVNALFVSIQPAIQTLRQDRAGVVVQWTASSGLKYTLQSAPAVGKSEIWADVAPANQPGPTGPPWSLKRDQSSRGISCPILPCSCQPVDFPRNSLDGL